MNNITTDIKMIDNKETSFSKINLRKLFVSPYGATLFPIFVLVFALLLPSTLYEYYVNEPDYIFLNFSVVFYASVCLAFYYFGIFVSNFNLVYKINFFNKKIKVSSFAYIGTISILIVVLQVLFIIVFNLHFVKATGLNLFTVAFRGKSDLVKNISLSLSIPLGLGAMPNFILGFEFWLLYYFYRLANKDCKICKKYKYLKFSILLSAFLYIFINIIISSRPALIIFILGWAMIYTYFNKRRLFFIFIELTLIIILIFTITSIFRWASGSKDVLYLIFSKLFGYVVAPYNRLALIINGSLNYNLPELFYLLPIYKIPLTNIQLYPNASELNFLYAYPALFSAGLNTSYNMTTLFGSIYETLSVASPIYFAMLGIIGNRLFHFFKKGRTFGIIFYPLFYASVALWIVDVNLFLMMFFYFFYSFVVLMIYNAIIKPKEYL